MCWLKTAERKAQLAGDINSELNLIDVNAPIRMIDLFPRRSLVQPANLVLRGGGLIGWKQSFRSGRLGNIRTRSSRPAAAAASAVSLLSTSGRRFGQAEMAAVSRINHTHSKLRLRLGLTTKLRRKLSLVAGKFMRGMS